MNHFFALFSVMVLFAEANEDGLESMMLTPILASSANACTLPKEVGPCKAYFPSYYYNIETGKCESFIFGGCRGNDNRFATKMECEEMCLSQGPPESCNLPKKRGRCPGYFPRYYYSAESKSCEPFVYGGCEGNENNFKSKEACEDKCATHESTPPPLPDKCDMPKEVGPCLGYFPRYYYDAKTESCKQFVYGGCRGNENNFKSKDVCMEECGGGSATLMLREATNDSRTRFS